jgi:hypothetical protein
MSQLHIDESEAFKYVGKTVLLGITYLDAEGNVTARREWYGTIQTYSDQGIKIQFSGSDQFWNMPPVPKVLRKAKPGVYQLLSTNEIIHDPDFLCTWTMQEPKK